MPEPKIKKNKKNTFASPVVLTCLLSFERSATWCAKERRQNHKTRVDIWREVDMDRHGKSDLKKRKPGFVDPNGQLVLYPHRLKLSA